MKKTVAILLMSLLVFNITGYRFTLHWMQQQQNASFEKQLDDAGYDEASLMEVTVPLSLPYYNNWNEFERYDGEIQLNGLTYKYVKRKIENGKLVLKCLPNPQQQAIQKSVSNAFAQANGLPTSDAASKAVKKIVKAGIFEYEELSTVQINNTVTISIEKLTFFHSNFSLQTIQFPPWQPPEFIS